MRELKPRGVEPSIPASSLCDTRTTAAQPETRRVPMQVVSDARVCSAQVIGLSSGWTPTSTAESESVSESESESVDRVGWHPNRMVSSVNMTSPYSGNAATATEALALSDGPCGS